MRKFAPVFLFWAIVLSPFLCFALNVDSLPVWNESLAARDAIEAVSADSVPDTLKLETSGSKTISVAVGDGGTEMDQELHLSMKGYAAEGVYIDALLSDVGRSAGDQSTATLQEVDQVYFRVESRRLQLHLGDLDWKQKNLSLSGIERSTLGAMVGFRTDSSIVRAAYGIDEAEHLNVVINGVNGQRDGYVIDGASGFLSVVPNSERVYLNGTLLERNRDYVLNYAGGVLDFKGDIIPGLGDEIRVEYDAYNSGYASNLVAGEGRYRSKHIWLDVAGFKLQDDVDRLKRGSLDSMEYAMLKQDEGDAFDRADTMPELSRPKSLERAGARFRAAYNNAYIDLETAFNRRDTNTVSKEIKGPEGLALRWNVQSDSSYNLNNFPIMLGLYGNYYEDGFDASEYQGSDRDWDSYLLKEEWDLDSLGLGMGRRHDELTMKARLNSGLFAGSVVGYRQSTQDSAWNAFRLKTFLEHRGKSSFSNLAFVHVRSEDFLSGKRYQGLLNSEYRDGFVRPFASADYAYWELDDYEHERLRFKQDAGLLFVGDNYQLKESVGSWWERVAEGSSFEDSLKQVSWTQSANANWRYLKLEHLLQYKHTELMESGNANTWLSSQQLHGGNSEIGIEGSLHYDFGLTQEQPYVAIYKVVAAGTGDVMYDSATGQFIEGVDNGNYVYEGMGRSDSLKAVETSNASAEFNLNITPASLLGIRKGVLRDLTFGIEYRGEAYDTTGENVFLPPFTPSEARDLSSGLYFVEGDIGWSIPSGIVSLHYYPGNAFEKKNLSYKYEEDKYWHRAQGLFTGRKDETWKLEGLYEVTDLNSIAIMDWKIYEGYASWRRELPLGFFVEPGAKIRYGQGEESEDTFEALMREGDLKVGYLKEEKVDASILFSTINLDSDVDYLPYQMMSGYDDGWTFRIEAFAEMNLSNFFTLSSRYIIRFGNAESRRFQKWTMEARAYF